MTGCDSVLLIAFGGPEKPEDIRPFLEIVTAGRQIPPERIEEVAHHYEAIGGRSPLNELTRRQAEGLRRLLVREGVTTPVYVGMRNWHPFLHETLAAMRERGHRRALGIILSSFQTEASWERYVADVAAARVIAGRLGHGRWQIAYQSRSGPPGDPWLEPDICDVLRGLGDGDIQDAVAAPIGFVCDHVEVLYDLDVEARAVAAEVGVRFHRAQT